MSYFSDFFDRLFEPESGPEITEAQWGMPEEIKHTPLYSDTYMIGGSDPSGLTAETWSMLEAPADFPTYDPAQSLTDYTFFEYDDQGRIDVAATEDNQAEFQKLYENYRDGEIGYNTYSRQISELQQKAGSPVSFINIGDQDSKALLNAAKFLSNVGGDSANQRMKAAGYPRSGRASGIPPVGETGTQSLAKIAMEGMRSTGGKFGVDELKNQVFVQPTISMSESPGSKRGSVTPTKTEVASARKTTGFNRYIQGLA